MKKLLTISLYITILFGIIAWVMITRSLDLLKDIDVSPSDFVKPISAKFADRSSLYFLFLGIGGGAHDGPDLTDSITVAKLNLDDNSLHTVGIPRDIWHPDIADKVNSVYAYSQNAEHKNDSYGYTKKHFSSLLGVPINSVFIIDFKTFESIIDALGGITITLNKGFVDPYFPRTGFENAECVPYDPDFGCRYTTLTFPKGTYEIKGKVALNFVRSRHSEGDSGSDFSRNARQQLMINATKEKIISLAKARQVSKLFEVIRILNADVKRDLANSDIVPIFKDFIFSGMDLKVSSRTFVPDYFEVPAYEDYDGKYVLIPKDFDYAKLKKDIKRMLQ